MIDALAAGEAEDRAVRVIFLGSGAFGVPILEALAEAPGLELVAVVSAPDRPAGRHGASTPSPVAARARAMGLHLLQPDRIRRPEAVAAVEMLHPDVGVLADYGQLIPASILALPRRGMLNVHPSVLPRHRGATPIAGTILAGDREAGVAVMVMDEGLDTGPLLAVERWPIASDARAPDLESVAARSGAALLVDVLPRWFAGSIEPEPQDDDRATLTRPFRREDGRLDPSRPAAELERRIRALDPWPGTWLETDRGRLAVLDGRVVPSLGDDRPGTLVADGNGIALATVDGRLKLSVVRPAGGRTMTGDAFVRGVGRDLFGRTLLSAPDQGTGSGAG